MPVTIHELDNGLGNVIIIDGVITSEEYDIALTDHLSKPEEIQKKYQYSIIDATQVTKVSVEIKYVKKIAMHSLEVAKINPNIFIVFAVHNAIAFNLARLWAFITSGSSWNVQVFRSREELDKWLLMKMKDTHDISDLELDYNISK